MNYRTYSATAFNRIRTIADASRGALKAAEAAWEDARTAWVSATAYVDKLTAGRPQDGQLAEAQRELAAAKSEMDRCADVRKAAGDDWQAKAALAERAADFIKTNRLKAV